MNSELTMPCCFFRLEGAWALAGQVSFLRPCCFLVLTHIACNDNYTISAEKMKESAEL